MNIYHNLGLIGFLINSLKDTTFDKVDNAELLQYLEAQGIGVVTGENLGHKLGTNVGAIEREFSYYDPVELKVNEPLNQYLIELSGMVDNKVYLPLRDVALAITGLGNKPGDVSNTNGVEDLLALVGRILDPYIALDGDELPEQEDARYEADARQLDYLDRVLGLLDVFVTSRLGMVAGIEEYAPLDYNAVHPIENFDIYAGTECSADALCKCGCAVDASLVQLKGMSDLLEGNTSTPDYFYLEGVTNANGQLLQDVSGTEGAVFDAVKNLGKAAYTAAMETWKNVQAMFESTDDDADKDIANVADDNKKAIQSMKDKGVAINDKAKAGLTAMAAKADPSGMMGKVVAGLESPSSAPGVIDGLLGLLGTNSQLTKGLTDTRKAAQDALDALKKSTDSISGDDDNKEAAAAAKSALQEKIAAARETVGAAKKAAQDHNKVLKAIRKAIRGISPHIFVTKEPAKAKDDDK